MTSRIRIGTRGSQLALWQANWVRDTIRRLFPDIAVSLEIIKTQGDKIQDVPLAKVGGKGLFVKEIEEALLDRRIDLAVHSMKDMPALLPEGLEIAAVPEREDPRDAFISINSDTFMALPRGAVVGTSSLRRGAQLLARRPDIRIVPLRGNVDTRLKKLETENLDAIILAVAGMKRMGFESRIREHLSTDLMLPAVGQGALCIEARREDPELRPVLDRINHPETSRVVAGERAFLHRLEGGCQVPIAGHGTLANSMLTLRGMVAELDGSAVISGSLSGPENEAEQMGIRLAEQLLADGGARILADLSADFHQT